MAGFSTALSGLNANATALGVIGNNLANINTVAFKASTVSFQDLVSQTVSGASANPMQVGLGVTTGSITPTFSQGSIQSTSESSNVAIQGNGFFIVRGVDGLAYTRAGNFSFDNAGALVTTDGYKVQGYTQIDPATNQVITTSQVSDIVVPPGVLRAPTPTTEFTTLTNLNSAATANSTFTTSVQMYDPQGSPHVVTVTYTKTGPSAWAYQMTVPGAEVTGGAAGTPFPIPQAQGGAGTITFDTAGKLATVNGAAPADVTVTTPAWSNGAAANAMVWNLVDATTGTLAITGYASPSATSSITQNGSAPGSVNGVNILADGSITATFGAGQTVTIGKIAIAAFNNPKGLVKLGANRFGESQAAGQANVGTPGNGGRGTLIGSALEQSNVDMAAEFTNMILAQRGYQANSKSITVADELMQETLALKR
jgi:flagellar hook protein FlgE